MSIDRFLIPATILIAVALIVLRPHRVAHWSGHFTLTVKLDAAANVDRDSIKYLTCWKEGAANDLCEIPGEVADPFRRPDRIAEGGLELSIMSGGESGVFGLIDTYHHPEFVVIQYRFKVDESGKISRKAVRIPKGRGDRSVAVTIP